MRPGQRETPIYVLRAVQTGIDPTYNNPIIAWQKVGPFWAAAEFRKGREFYENGFLITQNAMRFEIDWLDGQEINESMRIECDGKNYDIKGIDRDLDLKRHVAIEAISGINEVEK